MYCKFCGQDIPENADFCPECGKKLKKETASEPETRGAFSLPLTLMLLLLCGSALITWGRILLFGDRLTIGTLVYTLALLAGIAVLTLSIHSGRVDPTVYRLSDAAVLACAALVVPNVIVRLDMRFFSAYWGQDGAAAALVASDAQSAIQLTPLWLAVGIALLGCARTAQRPSSKRERLLLRLAPLVCVLLGISFTRPLIHSVDAPLNVLAIAISGAWTWSLLSWLWPLVILRVFRACGEGRVGALGAAAAFLGTIVGEGLLLLVFLSVFKMGMTGWSIAHGLAPLFALPFLRVAARHHKTN